MNCIHKGQDFESCVCSCPTCNQVSCICCSVCEKPNCTCYDDDYYLSRQGGSR